MTIQQLSEWIAELYDVPAYKTDDVYMPDYKSQSADIGWRMKWLVSDWNRLMPLAVENRIDILQEATQVCAYPSQAMECENYTDHPSKEVATQVAIARALIAIKE